MFLPTQKIDPSISSSEICLNLTKFNVNPITLGSAEFWAKGYNIEVPSYTRTDNKTNMFEYAMDSNLSQYIFLYKWLEKIVPYYSGSNPDVANLGEILINIRVWILSEFKKPVLEVVFEDCWLSELGGLNFDYQGQDEVIKSSFTIKYGYISFNTNFAE
jgi:hypothetical protein